MPLSFLWEKFVAFWNYHGAPELVPARLGLFESTPVVNDEFVPLVKSGKCAYIRCDIECLTKDGVTAKVRDLEAVPGEGKEMKEVSIYASMEERGCVTNSANDGWSADQGRRCGSCNGIQEADR